MGELGRDWLRGVGVTVPVTGGGGVWGEQPSLAVMLATGQFKNFRSYMLHSRSVCGCFWHPWGVDSLTWPTEMCAWSFCVRL